jgi:hypothetical protein
LLLLLCYPPPSVDSFAMLDACFLRLLRICPQVTPRQFALSVLPSLAL